MLTAGACARLPKPAWSALAPTGSRSSLCSGGRSTSASGASPARSGGRARWLSEPANAKRLGDYVALQLPQIARSLPLPRIGELIGTIAQQAAQAVPAAPVASKLLAIVWAQGEAQALLAQAIEQSEAWLAGNKDVLTEKISERSSRWIPKWIDW